MRDKQSNEERFEKPTIRRRGEREREEQKKRNTKTETNKKGQ
jgi:hypothetical protein